MTYAAATHHRKSIRLTGYDYSQQGAYFITICVQNKICLFTSDKEGNNDSNQMIKKWWQEIANKFTVIELDEYVVMPNHIHGIIFIEGQTHRSAPTGCNIPAIVQWFKTMTTNEYIRNVSAYHWPSFEKRLWQRNYFEHIIRNEQSLEKIREYIRNNPKNWKHDELYMK